MYGLLRMCIHLHVIEYYFLQWLIHDKSMLTFDYLHVMDFKSHYIFLVYLMQLKVLGCSWLKTFNTSEFGCKELKIVVSVLEVFITINMKELPNATWEIFGHMIKPIPNIIWTYGALKIIKG
jgi:hypothetical protein